ncbi:prolipoprotein diacylglyceryl transferase [Microvirga sp. W0021]|uniref:Phosphatidylglycerol--prolipoprotein diacylglyceryl transferase n=1 Tax=Hohaiivirga grylli TaxID=3133970 RepID=A0ABV0BNY8_9HYPH
METFWTAPVFDPIALSLGPLAVRWYALAYIVGLLGGWYYARKLASHRGLWQPQNPPTLPQLDDLLVYVAIGVVLGGRLGQVLIYERDYYFSQPVEILKIWKGGMAFHGGLLGSLVAVSLFSYFRKLNVFAIFDLCCTVVPIGLFFGRIANFINGELWGRVADGVPNYPNFPYAMIFPRAEDGLPRYPSQLYEAFAEGLVLFVIMAIVVRCFGFRRPGILSGLFLIGYGLARSICEIFREPEGSFIIGGDWSVMGGGITQGMFLSLPMIICGVIVLILALNGWMKTKVSTTV